MRRRIRVANARRTLPNKFGGHKDQLSTTVEALDRYRVKAIEDILQGTWLLPEEREAATAMLKEKFEILRKGASKRI